MAVMPDSRMKRKRRGVLRNEDRMKAVERLKDESNVHAQMKRLESKRGGGGQEFSAKGALTAPRRGGDRLRSISGREPKYKTERGQRRLSFAQAYARRTTDSSRQRVLDLYGRSKPPSLAAETRAKFREGVVNPMQGGMGRGLKPPRATINVPRPGDSGSRRVHRPVDMSGTIADQVAKARQMGQRRRKRTGYTGRKFDLRG